jgi:Recombination endonuclease VII
MGRPRINGICYNCEKQAISKGFCAYHYNKQRIEADPSKANSGLRGHPYYHLWFERKTNNDLVEEWLDFKIFIKDVGERPSENHIIVRPIWDQPYGPKNFEWYEKLAKRQDETRKEFWARKWKSRRIKNPKEEYNRNLIRNFGITIDDYENILIKQNHVCAICEEIETETNKGNIKNMAVDHCHKSGNIRELLCTRCNRALGSINDSVELLQKMINYLNKHKDL